MDACLVVVVAELPALAPGILRLPERDEIKQLAREYSHRMMSAAPGRRLRTTLRPRFGGSFGPGKTRRASSAYPRRTDVSVVLKIRVSLVRLTRIGVHRSSPFG
jgi:hypothetical protein